LPGAFSKNPVVIKSEIVAMPGGVGGGGGRDESPLSLQSAVR
jgi:hypothetical protein